MVGLRSGLSGWDGRIKVLKVNRIFVIIDLISEGYGFAFRRRSTTGESMLKLVKVFDSKITTGAVPLCMINGFATHLCSQETLCNFRMCRGSTFFLAPTFIL